MENWAYNIESVYGELHKVIQNTKTKEVIAIVDSLDRDFVMNIIEKHNEGLSIALKQGSELAKEVYQNKSTS